MFVPDYCARDQGLTALCLRVSSAGTRLSAAIGSGCYSAHRGLPVMSVADGRPHRLRFATFEVDAGSRELFRQGRKVKLQEQPFQLLVALLERPGEVLTREELKQRVWPDAPPQPLRQGPKRQVWEQPVQPRGAALERPGEVLTGERFKEGGWAGGP